MNNTAVYMYKLQSVGDSEATCQEMFNLKDWILKRQKQKKGHIQQGWRGWQITYISDKTWICASLVDVLQQ